MRADSLINFNAQFYSMDQITKKAHPNELSEEEEIHLYLDLTQMGVGGDDGWTPRVHDEYELNDQLYQYKYQIEPNMSLGGR